MKTRIISALVGLVLLGVVLALYDTLVLNFVISLLCIMAVLELLKATGCMQHKGLTALSVVMTVFIPFVRWVRLQTLLYGTVFVLVLVFFLLMIASNAKLRIEQVAMAFFFSTIIPAFFSCAVYLRDDHGPALGIFYLLLALGSAWLCDTGAYFTGIRFGKHKLAPNISPKKTVEGAVGGVVLGTLFMLLLAFCFQWVLLWMGTRVAVNYLLVGLFTPIFAIIGMLGDLSASVIKRQYGVKDFGHIMPGHGGVLDRFDSVLFTLPSVYIVVRHLELVTLL